MDKEIKGLSFNDIDDCSTLKDEIIQKLASLEKEILTFDKGDNQSILNIKKRIVNLKDDIKNYGEFININGYETHFIKKHIKKYESFFLKKLL